MLTFACIWADRSHGPEAVNILYDMVRRNLPFATEGRFICYTDFPDQLHAGIEKRPWHFELEDDSFLLQLDCCIVRPLDGLLERQGLEYADYDGTFPKTAHIVEFPGKKPHECDGWVKHVWKVGGGTTAELKFLSNVGVDVLEANIRSAISRQGVQWFEPRPAHEETAIIVGGGPSLAEYIPMLRYLAQSGQIFALNGVPEYLEKFDIIPDFHVMLDAHSDCLKFVAPHLPMKRYYASQCDPKVLDLAGSSLVCWHGGGMAMNAIKGHTFKHIVGGGTTGATRTPVLAYGLGFRKFHLLGMDSSYEGDKGHAYDQFTPEASLSVTCGEQVFRTSPQLLGQAEDFKMIIPDLVAAACEVTVHGEGLLQAVASQMAA